MLCCRHSSALDNPASPCFRIAMICSSLCRVPFTLLLLPGSACHLSYACFGDKSGSGELTSWTVQFLGAGSGSRILFLSEDSSKEVVQKAFKIGARAYVVKSDAGRELRP